MYCPTCKHPNAKILRTVPDAENASTGRTRMCKNPLCNTIFVTHESTIRIVDTGANAGPVLQIIQTVAQLPLEMQEAVIAALPEG